MPRTASAAEAALLASGHYHWYGRAEVTNASGTWIDVTSWVYGWSWGEAVDDASESGTIEFIREADVGGVDGGVVVADDFEDAIGAINARWPITKVGPETGTTAESWGQLTTTEGDTAIVVNTQNGIGFDNTGVFTAPHTYGPADGLVAGERYRVSCRMGLAGFNTTSQIAGLRAIGETTVEVLTPDFGDQTLQTFVRADAAGEITVELFLDTTPLTGGWSRQWTVNTVRIADAAQGRHSLAPLWQGSPLNVDDAGDYAPLVQPFRRVRLWEAVVAPGTEPTEGAWPEGDWHEVFRGVIDDPDWGGQESRVVCGIRGEGARLADAQIEVVQPYASALLETVLQLLLDNSGFSDVLLLVPVSPAWTLVAFEQPVAPVFEALDAKALQIGWRARYRWDDTLVGDPYRLTLYEPERSTAVVDLTYTPSQVERVSRLKLDGAGIRNVVDVHYVDGATGQPAEPERYEDAGSIAAYGRRWMQLGEGATSNIDTAAEALAMATAAVQDLSTPLAEMEFELLPDFRVQLHDVIELPPLERYFDTTQRFGVVAFRQERGGGHGPRAGRTFVTVRGTPAGAYTRWLRAQGGQGRVDRTGVPSPVIGPFLGESSLDGGVIVEGACWLDLQFDTDTREIEVYTSTGATTPLAAPLQSDTYRAYTVKRQEGASASRDDFRTKLLLATTPSYHRKVLVRALGYGKAVALPVILETQAVDTHAPSLGAITSFAVARSADKTSVTLTWTEGASTSDHAVVALIWRNGLVIDEIPAGIGTYTDSDILTDREYTYEVQLWSAGISGQRSSQWVEEVPSPPAPDPGDPASSGARPVFVNGTPTVLMSGTRALFVEMEAVCNDPAARSLGFQSYDGQVWRDGPGTPEPYQWGDDPVLASGHPTYRVFRAVTYDVNGVVLQVGNSSTANEVQA